MATTATHSFSMRASVPAVGMSRARRRITPRAGHALEILGHAIEYLTDEFIEQGGDFAAQSSQVQAVQLLMALNRQVYFECPEAPSFGERCYGFFRSHFA